MPAGLKERRAAMLRSVKRVVCPKCGHKFLAFEIEDSATAGTFPVNCPKCGAVVNPVGFVQKIFRLAEKVMKSAGAKLVLVAAVFATASCTPGFLRDGATPEEMEAASAAVAAMSPAEILLAFQEDGVSDAAVAGYFHASRYVIARLRSGETVPTASMEATIRGAYTNYLLLGRSWRWLARGCPADQWYAFPDPLMEETKSETDGLEQGV